MARRGSAAGPVLASPTVACAGGGGRLLGEEGNVSDSSLLRGLGTPRCRRRPRCGPPPARVKQAMHVAAPPRQQPGVAAREKMRGDPGGGGIASASCPYVVSLRWHGRTGIAFMLPLGI